MSDQFIVTVVDLYKILLFFKDILIYFVIKDCLFCSFPQTFHLCFCVSQFLLFLQCPVVIAVQ